MNPTDLIAVILRFALNSVLASLTLDPKRDAEDLNAEREAAAAMLTALDPRDAIQASFAIRAVTAHHASVECSRRAALPGVPDAMVRRLMITGMALTRQSMQMINALEKRKGAAHSEVPSDPIEAILAASAALQASRSEQQPGPGTSQDADDAQPSPRATEHAREGLDPEHPLPREISAAAPGISPPAPLYRNRQERRHAERQAAKASGTQATQRGQSNRHGKLAA